jgi:hypothetical protein
VSKQAKSPEDCILSCQDCSPVLVFHNQLDYKTFEANYMHESMKMPSGFLTGGGSRSSCQLEGCQCFWGKILFESGRWGALEIDEIDLHD